MTDLAPGFVQFRIAAGQLVSYDSAGVSSAFGTAYSGNGVWLDDPDATALRGHGPLPCGWYIIGAPVDRPHSVGEFALPLTPWADTEMHGRSGFWCHGDNPAQDHSASDGCIVAARLARQIIATYHRLQVVP